MDTNQPSADAATTEIVARAVIERDGRVLVARATGECWWFLPGGHVEPGECIEAALVRELAEELGTAAEVVGLVGVVENRYVDRGGAHHELNFAFEVTIADDEPAGREEHLEFDWLPRNEFAGTEGRPAALWRALTAIGRQEARVPFWHGWRE